ncbi:MAG: protein kinase [Isosphaeraceae bacterium]
MSAKVKHPPLAMLQAYGLGQLAGDRREKVERHVARCGRCARLLGDVPEDSFLAKLKRVAAPTQSPEALAPGVGVTLAELPAGLRDHPRYRVTHRLGAGGMGVVYLAEHRVMERPVALKVIHPALVGSRRAVERFRREVKVAARLSHRNVVAALDAERAEGAHFLVMEYVEGISLDRVVAGHGPLPVGHACAYVRQAARGLQHAHERGTSHRDVKPQNLMLTSAGLIKILDFGLAKFVADTVVEVSGASGEIGAPSVDGLTRTGSALGTPAYMAPEQAADASQCDVRSDLYSLGATLFFLLTGRPPFDRATPEALWRAHREEPAPPPSSIRQDVPPELDAIVARLLAKRPEDRYATPAELAEALGPHCVSATSPAKERPRAVLDATDRRERKTDEPSPVIPRLGPSPKSGKTGSRVVGLTTLALAILITTAIVWRGWPDRVAGSSDPSGRGVDRPARTVPSPQPERAVGTPAVAKAGSRLRLLLVAPQTNLWYPDYGNLLQALRDGRIDAEVRVASSSRQPIQTTDHPPVPVDLVLTPTLPLDFDAVIFLGSYPPLSMEYVAEHPQRETAFRLIHASRKAGVLVAGLCGGAAVLAESGVLRGIDCARCPYILETLEKSGASRLLDQPVVVSKDHSILTAREPDSAWDLVAALVETLRAREQIR